MGGVLLASGQGLLRLRHVRFEALRLVGSLEADEMMKRVVRLGRSGCLFSGEI